MYQLFIYKLWSIPRKSNKLVLKNHDFSRDLGGGYHHSNGTTILNWWLISREYIKGNDSETKLSGYYPNRSPDTSLWVGPGIWSTDRRDDVCAIFQTPYVGDGHPTLVLGFFALSQYTQPLLGMTIPLCVLPTPVVVVHWQSELR